MKKLSLILCALLLLALPGTTWADPITIRFNELPTQPANGVSLFGVRFGYTAPAGATATFNALLPFGPPEITHLQCPCLEGDARGTLTLDFETPTSFLSFGLARSTSVNLVPGFIVQLFDPFLIPIGAPIMVNTGPIAPFFVSENFFNVSGPMIGRTVITFSLPLDVTRFAMDNLTFDTQIPEPGTMALLGIGLAGIGAVHQRRRKTAGRASEHAEPTSSTF